MRGRRAVLLAAAALLAAGLAACATPGRAPAGDRLVQVLHRDARLKSGALDTTAVEASADAVVRALTGEELPLDAWAAIANGRDVTVLALPAAGPLARAVQARLDLVGPASLVERVDLVPRRARVVLVTRPAWRAGNLDWPAADVARVRLTLADLFDAPVGTETWRADVVLGAWRTELVTAGAEYVLGAHASGRIPDWDALARARGVDPARVEWLRLAVAP